MFDSTFNELIIESRFRNEKNTITWNNAK